MEIQKSSNIESYSSNMIAHIFRLKPGHNLYKELVNFVKEKKIKSASVLSCVGSLQKLNIRLASGNNFLTKSENFEIVSLVGCISPERVHLHIAISDEKGITYGGHLVPEDNIIYTTAEIVLGEFPQIKFIEEDCEMSGWNELKIVKNEE